MTLKECVANVAEMRSPSADAATIIKYIALLERRIKTEIFDRAVDGDKYNCTDYTETTPEDTVLPVPDAYCEVYVWYCLYMLDLARNNSVNANNSYSLFTESWDRLASYWRRNHPPKGNAVSSGIYGI